MATRAKRVGRRERRRQTRLEAAAAGGEFRIVDPDAEAGLRLEAAAGDGEGAAKLRTFKMAAYTGGKLFLRATAPYPTVIDLSGLTVGAKSRPILRDHDPDRIVGHTTAVVNSGGSLTVAGVVSGANAHAAEITASADAGFPWQASVGAKAQQMAFVDRGESVTVNGRNFVGPLYVARKATLNEVSFVALGADDNTTARVLAASSKDGTMDFDQWLKAAGFDPASLQEGQRKLLQAAFDAEQADEGTDDDPPAKPKRKPTKLAASADDGDGDDAADPVAEIRAAHAAELTRTKAVRGVVARYGVETVKVEGKDVDLEAHAVAAGWSPETTELHALRASRGSGPSVQTHGADLNAQAFEASLLAALGLPEERLGKVFGEQVVNASLDRRYAGAGLHMLMDATIHAAGRHFGGSRKGDDYIRAAFAADGMLRASGGGFSTISLSGILGNVATKMMLAAYDAQKVTWPFFCGVRNHGDFKPHLHYRLDATGSFRKVGPDGELKHAGLAEAGYSNRLDTFGTMISLTRQMMVNDDMGAFSQIPQLIGRMANVRLEEAAYALLLSNPGAFFSAGNKNLLTGAGSVLGVDGYTAAEKAFGDRVDANGKPILLEPSVLLSGSGLKVTAELLSRETKMEATTTANKPVFATNPHAGKFTPVSSPYVNNTAIRDQDGNALTGQSDTQWFLLADPAVRAAVAVAFLNGRRVPTIEFAETDFATLGMQWRGYHDFGVGLEDGAAVVKSAGA